MSEFKKFISKQLLASGLKDAYVEKLVNFKEAMDEYTKAFTHKSMGDARLTYEFYEFMGDGPVNSAIGFYAAERWPAIKSQAWMTRIKHTLMSGTYLAKIARKHGFTNHIRYSDDYAQQMKESPDPDEEMDKLLEDTFEAFCGCTRMLVYKIWNKYGLGEAIIFGLIKSMLDPMEITVDDRMFDSVTRLKELYDKLTWTKQFSWDDFFKDGISGRPIKVFKGKSHAEFSGTVHVVDADNKVIGRGQGKTLKKAKEAACQSAIESLEKRGIKWQGPPKDAAFREGTGASRKYMSKATREQKETVEERLKEAIHEAKNKSPPVEQILRETIAGVKRRREEPLRREEPKMKKEKPIRTSPIIESEEEEEPKMKKEKPKKPSADLEDRDD
jgi:dsRNA-specific ribonuclease